MNTQVKPRERVQAQIAAFAHDEAGQESTRAYQTLQTPELYTSPEYVAYLRQCFRHDNRGDISNREHLLVSYADFSSEVSTLLESIEQQKRKIGNQAIKDRGDFLGAGGFARVFKIMVNDTPYAVRLTPLAPTFDYIITTALRAKGIPHTEKLVAASYDDEVTVSEYVEGSLVYKMSEEELNTVSDNQIYDLILTLCQMGEKRVAADANVGNFIYDNDNGFTVIDFRPQNLRRVPHNLVSTNIRAVVEMFSSMDMKPNDISERMRTIAQPLLDKTVQV